jgi:hypothetical protein
VIAATPLIVESLLKGDAMSISEKQQEAIKANAQKSTHKGKELRKACVFNETKPPCY